MTSLLLADIASLVASGLEAGSIPFDITYRQSATWTLRAGANALAGATTVTLAGAPSGFAGTATGDVFNAANQTLTVSNAVAPVAGVMAGITFAPALANPLSLNTQVVLRRTTTYTVRGFDEQASVFRTGQQLVQAGDWKVTLIGKGLAFVPLPGDQVTLRNGKVVTVISVGSDPAGAVYELQCR